MRTKLDELNNFEIDYPLEKIAPKDKILFVDIETTGFTAKSSKLYLIGVAYYDKCWTIKQWFASSPDDEKFILEAFIDFSKGFTHLIHFNGNQFDIPYLKQKSESYGLDFYPSQMEGIDLYRRTVPFKEILFLNNCKQKTVESFLGINREDVYGGGELIEVYHNYVENPTDYALELLMLHNHDDMKGMLSILPILAYSDLYSQKYTAKKVQANSYTDMSGKKKRELVISFVLEQALPVSLKLMENLCFLQIENNKGTLRVPLYCEELKYFYANYKSYYYLPAEDQAIHKSIASTVDKNYREQAKASNCYTRKSGNFLPQMDIWFEPLFKRSYEADDLFFELTEENKQNRELFSEYVSHMIEWLIDTKKKK